MVSSFKEISINSSIISVSNNDLLCNGKSVSNNILAKSQPNIIWDARDLILSDGDDVTQWVDNISGKILTTVSNYPKYYSGKLNSRPWVYFSASTPSNPLICTDNIFSGSYSNISLAVVMRVVSYTAGYETPIICLGTSSPPNANGAYGNNALCLGWNATTTTNPGMAWKKNQNSDFGSNSVVAKHRILFEREFVMVVVCNGVNWQLWIDGICVSSDISSGPTTINGGIGIGSLYTPSNYRDKITMGVGMFSTWTRALSPFEVRDISRKLISEFTETQQRRVIFMGDSTYEGTGSPAGGTLLDVLQAEIKNAKLINAARGGMTMAVQDGVSPYPEMYSSLCRGDIVVLGPGSIDIVSLTSVATVQTNTLSVISKIHEQGAYVIAPTMIDEFSSSQSTSDANRSTLNSWYIAGSSGADYVADLTGIPEISDNGAHSNSTYFLPDGAHLKAPGIALQAAELLTIIQMALSQ